MEGMFPCAESHVSDMAYSGEVSIKKEKLKQKITKIITYETS